MTPMKMTLAALGLTLTAPMAFAEAHGDMTCSDFVVLTGDEQMEAAESGREAARDRMTGDDPDGAKMLEEMESDVYLARVIEVCTENPDMMVSDAAAAEHPSQKTE